MQIEVGMIFEGKVTGITKFGAFVELPEGKTGMVHISEVAPTFVNEIKDFLKENQIVKVKVLAIKDDKISLSIKKAMEQPQKNNNGNNNRHQNSKPRQGNNRPGNFEWQDSRKNNETISFEDMMSKFKQTSDEKMSDLKKINKNKRGTATPKRGGNPQQRI